MALVACPDCGREVSSRAGSCISCGCPLSSETQVAPVDHNQKWRNGFNLLARVGIGFFLFAAGADGAAEAAMIGGVLIAASAVPAWLRMRADRARLKAPAEGLVLERIADLEALLQDRLDQMESGQVGRLTEMEDRIEFAERLLGQRQQNPGTGGSEDTG